MAMKKGKTPDPTLQAAGAVNVGGNFVQLVDVMRNQAVTTSVKLADFFGKRHKDVLRAIDGKIATGSGIGNGRKIALVNMFQESTYTDAKGESRRMFYLTFEGFSLIAMGFTGEKALEFQLAYIDAFTKMQNRLAEIAANHADPEWQLIREDSKESFKDLHRVIAEELIPYAIDQGSKNAEKLHVVYSKLINASTDRVIRDNASIDMLGVISRMQTVAIITIRRGMRKGLHYKDIYQQTRYALMYIKFQNRRLLDK